MQFVMQYTDFSKEFFTFTVSYGFTIHGQVKLHYACKRGTAFNAQIFMKIIIVQIFVGISCTEFFPHQLSNAEYLEKFNLRL